MKLAAAHAIAGVVGADLNPEYIVPSVFNREVAPAVAAAVGAEARRSGLSQEFTEVIDPLHVPGFARSLGSLAAGAQLSTSRARGLAVGVADDLDSYPQAPGESPHVYGVGTVTSPVSSSSCCQVSNDMQKRPPTPNAVPQLFQNQTSLLGASI